MQVHYGEGVAHDHRSGKNTHGVDPNRLSMLELGFSIYKFFQYNADEIVRQHPASTGAAQSWVGLHSSGDLGICRGTGGF